MVVICIVHIVVVTIILMNYVLKHGVEVLRGHGDYIVPTVEVIYTIHNIALKLGEGKPTEEKMAMDYI